MTNGWAVVDRNGINIRTVSDTRRAAIVNWLCVEANLIIHALATDEAIERAWQFNAGSAIVTRVNVLQEVEL